MKKARIYRALAALLLLGTACQREHALEQEIPDGAQRVTLRIEGQDENTKVSVSDGDGKGSWSKGDQIAMYIKGNSANSYTNLTVNEENNCVLVSLLSNQDIAYYSVYPAAARVDEYYGNSELRVKYLKEHTLPQGLTDAQLNNYSPVPMVAANTDAYGPLTSVFFFHVGGMLRIKLLNYTRSDVTAIKVTLEGLSHVTGTYKVNAPASLAATGTLVSGTGNEVSYIVPSALLGTLPAELWLNVPLPTGDYTSLTGVKVSVVSASAPQSMTHAVQWGQVRHAQGKRLTFDLSGAAGTLDNVGIGSTDDVTLWKGESIVRTALGYDAAGTAVPGCTISWGSSDTAVATVSSDGTLTARGAGSAVITATASKAGVTKTESYTVYVNEIRSISVNKSSLYVRNGRPGTLMVTLDYTTNGNYVVPQLGWTSSNTSVASVQKTTTSSGEVNDINGLALGNTVITAAVPAGRYGSANHSISIPVTVLGSNYIPGPFSVSDSKQVFFASGNVLQVKTFQNGVIEYDWKFEDSQFACSDFTTLYRFSWGDMPVWRNNYDGNNGKTAYISFFKYSSIASLGTHFNDEGEGSDSFTDGTWSVLTPAEARYLFETRPNSKILRGYATIIDENSNLQIGYVLLPDNWLTPTDCTFTPSLADPSANVYVVSPDCPVTGDGLWSSMENAGAVFLLSCGSIDIYPSHNYYEEDNSVYLLYDGNASYTDDYCTGISIRNGNNGGTYTASAAATASYHASTIRLVHE